jgi:hypothetical protein
MPRRRRVKQRHLPRHYADGARVAISDRALRRGLTGALGTVVSYGRTRYLVQLDDAPVNGRYAGTRWRCYEQHLAPSDAPPPSSPVLAVDPPRAAAPAWPALTFARPTPEWVRRLVAEVLDAHGAAPILFEWRPSAKRRRPRGLGFADLTGRRIVIRDNGSVAEQRQTVLHELAHIVVGLPGHRLAFWDLCWTLYRDRGVDLDVALRSSANYKRALVSYRRVIGEPPSR